MSITKQRVFDTFSTLLVSANIVKESDLQEASGIAGALSIPLSKALVMSGVASEQKVSLTLQAQAMMEAETLSLDLAIRALRLAVHNDTDLNSALTTLASLHKKTSQVVSLTNELTSLLLSAKLITAEQLGEAIKHSQDSRLLIGHTLVLLDFIETSTLNAALHAVLQVRQKVLDKDKAAQGLRYATQREITIEQSLFELGFFTPPKAETMRLCELVSMSGLISQSDLVECLELELFKHKQFGQVLLEQGLFAQTQLDAAIELQGAVADEALKPYQAAIALRRVCFEGVNLYQAMAESKLDSVGEEHKLGELLVAANVCSQENIDKVLDQTQSSAIKLGKALLALGFVKESMLYTALRCQSLLRQGYFSAHQAVEVLAHCQNNDASFDQAQNTLLYNAPARMQWLWV